MGTTRPDPLLIGTAHLAAFADILGCRRTILFALLIDRSPLGTAESMLRRTVVSFEAV